MANYMAKFKDGSSSIVSDDDIDNLGIADDIVDLVKQPDGNNQNVNTSTPVTNEDFKVLPSNTQRRVPQRTGQVTTNISQPSLYQSPIDGATAPTAPTYKQLNTQTPTVENQPGYLTRSYDYAAGSNDTNPTLLGQVWKGAGNAVVDHPISLLAAGLTAVNPAIGIANATELGLSRLVAPSIARFIGGAAEGSGLSAADQVVSPLLRKKTVEGTEDKPNIRIFPTLTAGLLGGALNTGLGFFGDRIKDYTKQTNIQKEYNSDPTKFNINNKKINEFAKKYDEFKKEIDPYGWNTKYLNAAAKAEKEGTAVDPNWSNGVLGEAKKIIASKSPFPIKPSQVTNSEARTHVNDVISKLNTELENFDPISLINKEKPSKYNYSIGNISNNLPAGLSSAFVGHAVAGTPGAIIAGTLGYEPTRKLVGSAVSKSVPYMAKASNPITRGLTKSTQTMLPQFTYGDNVYHQDPLAPIDSSFLHF